MRVYSDVIPDIGKCVTVVGNTDAVVTLNTLPRDYVVIKWIAYSFNWNPGADALLVVKDVTNNVEYLDIFLGSTLTAQSFDVLNFGPNGINFPVGSQVEVRLRATGTAPASKLKSLSVSYQ